jgi:molybdate transport system regulatory protein
MNVLQGKIKEILTEGTLCLVYLQVGSHVITTVVLGEAEHYAEGDLVAAVFKETEVSVALPGPLTISLQNRIPGKVSSIKSGKLLSEIDIRTEVGNITSIITSRAVMQLELKEGKQVQAVIKTNEIMLES